MRVEVRPQIQLQPPMDIHITLNEYEAEGLMTILHFMENISQGNTLSDKLHAAGVKVNRDRVVTTRTGDKSVFIGEH